MYKVQKKLLTIISFIIILYSPSFTKNTATVKKGKQFMAPISIINSKKYSDWQNSSYIPVKGLLKGNEIWFSPIPAQHLGDSPCILCLGDNTLVTVYLQWIDTRNSITGDRKWTNGCYNSYEFSTEKDNILVIGSNFEFYKLSFQNVKTEIADIPIFSENYKVFYLFQEQEKYFYIYNRYPHSFDTRPKLIQGKVYIGGKEGVRCLE